MSEEKYFGRTDNCIPSRFRKNTYLPQKNKANKSYLQHHLVTIIVLG